MEYSHEIIVPNDDLPFKKFIFEGSQGGYIRQKHWHKYRLRHSKDIIQTTDSYIFLTVPGSRMKR